jgi:hypothetical protein
VIRGLPTTILSATLAGIVGVGLFFIKHEVKEQEARLAELNQEIQRNQEVIHVLKAEWSYLNDPARLRALSERFLSMKVMAPSQIVTLNTLPAAGPVYAAKPAPSTVAKAAPAPSAIAKSEPAKLAAAAPAPLPAAKAPAAQPGKPVYQPAPTKVAQSPAPQVPAKTPGVYSPPPLLARPLPAPQPGPTPGQLPGPGRSIVIQSPAIAETPGYPGEVR